MRYRQLPAEVEAMQWDPETFIHQTAPGWFRDAERKGFLAARGGRLSVYSPTHGKVCAEAGDWLVRQADNAIIVVPQEDFAERFELIA
jgi:hypothetical protein